MQIPAKVASNHSGSALACVQLAAANQPSSSASITLPFLALCDPGSSRVFLVCLGFSPLVFFQLYC